MNKAKTINKVLEKHGVVEDVLDIFREINVTDINAESFIEVRKISSNNISTDEYLHNILKNAEDIVKFINHDIKFEDLSIDDDHMYFLIEYIKCMYEHITIPNEIFHNGNVITDYGNRFYDYVVNRLKSIATAVRIVYFIIGNAKEFNIDDIAYSTNIFKQIKDEEVVSPQCSSCYFGKNDEILNPNGLICTFANYIANNYTDDEIADKNIFLYKKITNSDINLLDCPYYQNKYEKKYKDLMKTITEYHQKLYDLVMN